MMGAREEVNYVRPGEPEDIVEGSRRTRYACYPSPRVNPKLTLPVVHYELDPGYGPPRD